MPKRRAPLTTKSSNPRMRMSSIAEAESIALCRELGEIVRQRTTDRGGAEVAPARRSRRLDDGSRNAAADDDGQHAGSTGVHHGAHDAAHGLGVDSQVQIDAGEPASRSRDASPARCSTRALTGSQRASDRRRHARPHTSCVVVLYILPY